MIKSFKLQNFFNINKLEGSIKLYRNKHLRVLTAILCLTERA